VPDEINAGKGTTHQDYTFTATPVNIPDGAFYTWYSGGVAKKGDKDLKSVVNNFSDAKPYTLRVEAKWKDASGTQQSVSSQEVSFNIGGGGLVLSNGKVVGTTGACIMDNPSEFGNTFLTPLFSRLNITVANNTAIADQSISFNVQSDKQSVPCTAKVKFNGTVNKGTISGTFSVDAVATMSDGKQSVPIDIKYWGNFTSTSIPATPSGSITLTCVGPLQSHMLIKLIEQMGAACAKEMGGTTTGEFVPPKDDLICTSCTAGVQFSATQSGK
jgi:hypothetical protein